MLRVGLKYFQKCVFSSLIIFTSTDDQLCLFLLLVGLEILLNMAYICLKCRSLSLWFLVISGECCRLITSTCFSLVRMSVEWGNGIWIEKSVVLHHGVELGTAKVLLDSIYVFSGVPVLLRLGECVRLSIGWISSRVPKYMQLSVIYYSWNISTSADLLLNSFTKFWQEVSRSKKWSRQVLPRLIS